MALHKLIAIRWDNSIDGRRQAVTECRPTAPPSTGADMRHAFLLADRMSDNRYYIDCSLRDMPDLLQKLFLPD